MGYSTDFIGTLKFKKELTGSQLAYLKTFLGIDIREAGYSESTIYENGKYGKYWVHIDLELTDNFDGIQWNGSEKTYGLNHIVNFISDKMCEKYPDFHLIGELSAQGEEHKDRWRLVMKDGWAHKIEVPLIGQEIECPNCEETFILEEK